MTSFISGTFIATDKRAATRAKSNWFFDLKIYFYGYWNFVVVYDYYWVSIETHPSDVWSSPLLSESTHWGDSEAIEKPYNANGQMSMGFNLAINKLIARYTFPLHEHIAAQQNLFVGHSNALDALIRFNSIAL